MLPSIFHPTWNTPSMTPNMPGPNIPLQPSQNNFQAYHPPQVGFTQMQPSPSGICNTQDQQKQPSYQFYQGEAFHPSRQNTSNIPPSSNHCQPIYQSPYNTIPPGQIQQKQVESLPQSVLEQIRACVGSVTPIFILPGGCQQSTNQQPDRISSTNNQSGIVHTTQQAGFNYPPPAPVYCPPPFYPYPIPLPIYDSVTNSRNKVQNCECQKNVGLHLLNGRQCYCDGEINEHHCTPTTDDTICSKLNCPSSINLQALASQLLSVPGIISCAATRLILRKIPGSNITTTLESTMDTAQRSIGALTKDQLVAESRIAIQVNALINLHMNNNPPSNVVPILTLIQLKMNLLKAQIDSLINKRVMENEGYFIEVESAKNIDQRVLALKADGELRQLLSALRQKECDERVNVNFAPYHSQRAIAEVRLNNFQNKIRQVEAEFERRRNAALPIMNDIAPQYLMQTPHNTGSICPVNSANVSAKSYESPDPFAIKLRSPRRLCLKPHVGCPQTTYDSSTAPKTVEVPEVACNEHKSTETQRQETEDKANATSEEKENQTNEQAKKCEGQEECIFCNRRISEESVEEDKKKLRTNQRVEKATVVISGDKLGEQSEVTSLDRTTVEKDDTSLRSATNRSDPGYDEVTSDNPLSKVHWFSETLEVNPTKEERIGIESAASLHNLLERKTTELIETIENEILKRIEYKDTKEHEINDAEQLIFVAVKQEQTEPEQTTSVTKQAGFEMQIAL